MARLLSFAAFVVPLSLAALVTTGAAVAGPLPSNPPKSTAPTASAAPATTAAPATAGAPVSDSDKADALYNQAIVAGKANDWSTAYDLLIDAERLKKSHDILGNLGTAEFRLGRFRDAAEHFTASLKLYPANGRPEGKAFSQTLLDEAKAQVGTLILQVGPETAKVRVNGRELAPGERETVFVEPGDVVIEVGGLPGYESQRRALKAEKGKTENLKIELKPLGPVTGGPRKEIMITGGVVGGASLIAGAVLFGVATGMQADLQADAPKNPDGTLTCVRDASTGTTIKACDDFRERLKGNNALGQAGVGFIVAGGAVGLGTVLYALLAPSAPKSTGARVVPVATPSSAGLVMTGSF